MKHVIKALAVISCFSLTVLSTFLSSCEKNSDSENTEATKQVGIILYDESDVFLSEMIDEAKTYMANGSNGNINIVVRDAANSQNNEDEIVKEFIDEGVDVLCVNLVDRQEPSTIRDDAKEADTPVIFFNREPVEGDLLRWDKLYYVGADAAQSGEIQGKLAADAIAGGQHRHEASRTEIRRRQCDRQLATGRNYTAHCGARGREYGEIRARGLAHPSQHVDSAAARRRATMCHAADGEGRTELFRAPDGGKQTAAGRRRAGNDAGRTAIQCLVHS